MTNSPLLQHTPVLSFFSAAGLLFALAGDARAQSEADITAVDAVQTAIAESSSTLDTADAAALDAFTATLVDGSFTSAAPDAAQLDAAVATLTEGSRTSASSSGIQRQSMGFLSGLSPLAA
jgi:hypothetical protein